MPDARPWELLRGLVDEESGERLRQDFEDFRSRTGTDDGDLFVLYLYRIGRLEKEKLGEAIRFRGRPELSRPGELRRQRDEGDDVSFVGRSPEGGYALLGKIGEGSMGRIFVAKDYDLYRKVAFKQMSDKYAADEKLRTRFLNEVQITAQLDHPNIVPVYDLEVDHDGRFGYAMKLVKGRTLRDLLVDMKAARKRGKATDETPVRAELTDVLLRVCDAMSYAHSRGVLHRDLKPDNIMVGPFGEVFVMDWGLARLTGDVEIGGDVSNDDTGLTRVGDAVGTPAYMSPEQAQGKNAELDGRSDLYTLGLILQQISTLEPPVSGTTVSEVMLNAASGTRQPMRGARGAPISPALRAIVAKACAPMRADRYPDVEHFAEDIRRYQRGQTVSVYREPLLGRTRRFLERHVLSLFALALSVALAGSLLGMFGMSALFWNYQAQASREAELGRVLTRASTRSHRIDVEMLDWQGLMEGFASSSVATLAHAAPDMDAFLFMAEDFDAGRGPTDLLESPRYGKPVSLASPSFKLAPGVSFGAVSDEMRRLVRLKQQASETLQRSDENADPRVDMGPILWLYLGTESGVHLSYPGHGGIPASFDPRKRPWYEASVSREGATWGEPYVDVNGSGLVLPCSAPLRDASGRFLGVAGMDLAFDYLLGELLGLDAVPGATETMLLDSQGNVVARSSDARKAEGGVRSTRKLRLQRFEVQSVVDEIVGSPLRGSYLILGEELYVWYRLDALDWVYVVRGPESALREG